MRSFQMCRVKGRFRKRLREGKRNSSNLRRNKQRLENPIQHMAMGEVTGHGIIPKKGELKTRSLSKLPATTDPHKQHPQSQLSCQQCTFIRVDQYNLRHVVYEHWFSERVFSHPTQEKGPNVFRLHRLDSDIYSVLLKEFLTSSTPSYESKETWILHRTSH